MLVLLLVSLLSATVELGATARPLAPKDWIEERAANDAWLRLHGPGQDVAGAPVALFLHGACSDARATCRALGDGVAGVWLACPEGNAACGGARDWVGGPVERGPYLDAIGARVRERYGALVARPGGDVLVGFSRGAFVARDAVYGAPGRYRALVLIGAAVTLDPKRLKEAGIERVLLACGQHDGARPHMIGNAARLQRAGIEARFVSTGPIYHALPPELDRFLEESLRWAMAGDEPS